MSTGGVDVLRSRSKLCCEIVGEHMGVSSGRLWGLFLGVPKDVLNLKRHGPFVAFYFYCKIMLYGIDYRKA